jgi:predicted phage terminase large subunit-like protein
MALVKWRDVPKGEELQIVRFWDLAASEPKVGKRATDPDWTAGALVGLARGEWYLCHMVRVRKSPKGVEDTIWAAHLVDDERIEGRFVPIRIELEGGSGGSITIDQFQRGRFAGVDLKGVRPRHSKVERARPFSVTAEAGHVHLVEDTGWSLEDFLDEIEVFPDGVHDDQVDAVVGGFHVLRPKDRQTDYDTSQSMVANEGGAGWSI